MRAAPLTTLSGGIDRQRLKGGARADVLYDFVNGYLTDAGTARSRPGSQRVAKLDEATRGLVSFDGSLHTFCHRAVYVPSGFTLNILVRPDKEPENEEPAFTVTADYQVDTGTYYVGADVVHCPAGTLADVTLPSTDIVTGLYSISTDSVDAQTVRLEMQTYEGGAPAADAFDSITFTDALGVSRTFVAADADTTSDETTYRYWEWDLYDPAKLFDDGDSYVVTIVGVGETGTTTTPGENFALEKIHFAQPFMGALYVVAEFDDGGVFHYWLQQGEQWEADKVYKAGDLVYPETPTGFVYRAKRLGSANPPWAANALRYDGTTSGYEASVIEPTVYNDFYYTCIATTGASPRSGETEPEWPVVDGATVIESTDNPPDVNIPTTTVEGGTNTPASTTVGRYGALDGLERTVLR